MTDTTNPAPAQSASAQPVARPSDSGRPASARPASAHPESAHPSQIRVVVADDHPIVRGGIVGLLGRADDIDVIAEASDGAEAVRLAAEFRPDLVLMDLRMPHLSGAEATARIIETVPEVRVLILTTYETDDDILGAIEAGASGYLLKAAPQEEILAGIRSVVGGRTVLAPEIAAKLVDRMRAGAAASAAAASAPARPVLSARELEVLRLVAAGNSNARIAKSLFISEATVKTHLLHVFEKLTVNDRTRAVTLALELNLL
ncbi:response regulator [Plantibacter sp. Mn2098]|uniref:response regulator n=1 Tax=Plantibacter sp. Mn2098 TaxID=3395266 RepID=UPI003BE06C67